MPSSPVASLNVDISTDYLYRPPSPVDINPQVPNTGMQIAGRSHFWRKVKAATSDNRLPRELIQITADLCNALGAIKPRPKDIYANRPSAAFSVRRTAILRQDGGSRRSYPIARAKGQSSAGVRASLFIISLLLNLAIPRRWPIEKLRKPRTLSAWKTERRWQFRFRGEKVENGARQPGMYQCLDDVIQLLRNNYSGNCWKCAEISLWKQKERAN